jgi:sporulation protein YlmC with PRC-barrel domain
MSVDAANSKEQRSTARTSERVPLTLHCGTSVLANDGPLGSVAGLVIDVRRGDVTHVVVTNADMAGTGRIVPLSYVTSGDGDDVHLSRSRAETLALDRLTVPYDLGDPFPPDGHAEGIGVWLIPPGGRSFAVHDTLPYGSLVLRPPVSVRTKEGELLGSVASWDIDPTHGRVRTVVVRRGHLLSRHLLPISGPLIDYIDDDGVHLTATRARLLGF